jgi:hypothetical protein
VDEGVRTYPKGQIMGMWMALGIILFSGIGIPLSIVTDNPGLIAIGPAIGVAFGVALGTSMEARYEKKGLIRPLPEQELTSRWYFTIGGLALLAVGLVVSLLIWW